MVDSFKSRLKNKSKSNIQKTVSVQGIKQMIQSYLKKTRSDDVSPASRLAGDITEGQASCADAGCMDAALQSMQSMQTKTMNTTQLKVVENVGPEDINLAGESGEIEMETEAEAEPDLEQLVTCSGAEWADAVESQNGQVEHVTQPDLIKESLANDGETWASVVRKKALYLAQS